MHKYECWMWLSDTPLCYKDWLPGEPNTRDGGEDCGELKGNKGKRGWNDLVCGRTHWALCEW